MINIKERLYNKPEISTYLDNRLGGQVSKNINVLDIIDQILEEFPEDCGNFYIYDLKENSPDVGSSSFPSYRYPYHRGKIPLVRWKYFMVHLINYKVYTVTKIKYDDKIDFKINAMRK